MTETSPNVATSDQPEQLRTMLALHEVALGTMSHGLCVLDSEYRIVLFNQRFLELCNFSPDAVHRGSRMRDVFAHSATRGNLPHTTAEAAWRKREAQLSRGEPFRQRRQLPNGRTIAINFQPLADGGWVLTYEDVTKQQSLEYELRLQVERIDQAIGAMSQGLSVFGADERLIVCNEQYLRIYQFDPGVIRPGIAHREILAHGVATGLLAGVPVDALYEQRMAALRRREMVTLNVTLSDGRMIQTTSRPTSDGGWVSDHEDITEQRRYQDALTEQNLRFDAALENMGHGLCMFDRAQRVIVRNRRFLAMFGLSPDMAKPGTALIDIMRHSVALGNHGNVTAEELLAQSHAGLGGARGTAWHYRMADGRIIAVRQQPMADGGRVVTYEDITERETAAQKLREQNLRFDAAVNNIPQGLCMFDADQRLTVCNDKYVSIFQADPDVVKPGITLLEVFEHGVSRGLYPGWTAEELLARRRAALAGQRPLIYDQDIAGGRTIAVSITPMANGGWVGTFEDITERHRLEAERAAAQAELREQYLRFDAALNNMPHGLNMFDANLRLIVCNRRCLEMFGLSPDVMRPGVALREVVEHSIAVGNHADLTPDQLYRAYVKRIHAGDTTISGQLADGRVILNTVSRMAHGGWVFTFEDITERHQAEQRVAHMARHDALTDLPNRVLFRERMEDGLARVEAHGEAMAVLCLDLDNFKGVNDTLGHPVGDKLLATIAERLVRTVAPGDTIARLGGDEFAVLQCAPQPEAAETLARRLVEVVNRPVIVDGQDINTGVSIGIAIAPEHGRAADALMKCADLALYRAKADGRGTYRFFEPDMDSRVQLRRTLELDLRKALGAGEFRLVYQPLVRVANNELTGMEALLRWTHPERGPVAAREFIPLAEEAGLIGALGEWVLRTACSDAARWPDPVRLAVNLSPLQFRSRGLVATITNVLAASGLPARRLEIEITEAVLLEDDEATTRMLHQLRALGVRISMDDFGTGYSSLSYLRNFPFDKIKIDGSFIADLGQGRDAAAIIRAIAGLGASLGIETTAEGIETAEQLELVRRDGCTEAQGYFIGRPLPAAEVPEIIARFRREMAAA